MSPIGIRRTLLRSRRRIPVLFTLLALGLAIAAHHGGPGLAADHHGEAVSAMTEMCLAAFTAVGTTVLLVALGALLLRRWRPVLLPALPEPGRRAPTPRARAGPTLGIWLCVSRC